MSEISEGTEVVTPGGIVGVVDDLGNGRFGIQGVHSYKENKLVKVSEPIRVRVSRECYAESLVALAEECGFEEPGHHCSDFPHTMYFEPNGKWWGYDGESRNSLTYAQDLPQIEGWLIYWSDKNE